MEYKMEVNELRNEILRIEMRDAVENESAR